MERLTGFIKRQMNNFMIFRAYSLPTALKETILFPRDLFSASGRSSNILNIALFVTTRCNARCAMCNLAGIINDKAMPDMPMDKIESFLDEVKRYHPSIILFGGEPFVRTDIVDIVKAVKKRGLAAGMFTNGLLITQEKADRIMEEGLDYIAFSVQGTRDAHDKILGIKGAYDMITDSIRMFTKKRRKRTKAIIHATICEHNVNDLDAIAEEGLSLGVDLVRFGHPTFCSSSEEAFFTASLKDSLGSDSARAMSYIYDISGKEGLYYRNIKKLQRKFGNKICFTPELGDAELKSWYSPAFKSGRQCLFMWRGAFVYPNGDLFPCESICYKMGNVFEESFSKIWNGPKYTAFRRVLKRSLLPACARCCKL